jgi:hypothetical protein
MTKNIRKLQIIIALIMACIALFLAIPSDAISFIIQDQQKKSLQWPDIKNEHKPITWWNWHGSAVNKKDIKRLLEEYHKAGLGGVNIMATYGAKGYEDQYIDFLNPKWVDMLAYTSKLGDQLNMTVDLEATTGWNMGGPWVRFQDAAKRVVLETYTLQGGQILEEPVKSIQEPYTNLKELPRQPMYLNSLLHRENLYDVRYKRDLPLLALMAYSNEGKTLDLTGKVGKDGKLNWIPPDGKWNLYAVFLGTGGKTVERAAPGGVGWQIDYLSKKPMLRQMSQFEEAFSQLGYKINELVRAFHDDSFEQYTDWTKDLFDKFKEFQGYDLRHHLPALFSEGMSEKSRRVRIDYKEAVSKLFVQEHTIPWTEWAHARGVITINQVAQGSPAHPLDNWGASDQPENTGSFSRNLYSNMASSAANVMGRRIISQETATIMHGHFHNSLADIKNEEIDKIFLNGANKICYHSTSYSPEEAKWPGWLFYAPVHFAPTNTIWKDIPKLNSYVARVSSFLQSGEPDNNLLLYYPIYDLWDEEERWISFPGPTDKLKATASSLHNMGYTFDYISDQQITNTIYKDGCLVTEGGNDYCAIVLPFVNFIALETLDHLLSLAEDGATIIFSEGLPKDVPGLGQLEERQNEFKKLIERIENSVKNSDIKGNIFLNQSNTKKLLPVEANIPRELMAEEGLKFVRRSYNNGYHYFIKNVNDNQIDKFVTLSRDAESVAIFDPLTDEVGIASIRENNQNKTEVFLQMEPGETCILRTFDKKVEGKKWKYLKELDKSQVIKGWAVIFLEGGPVIPQGFRTKNPTKWTQEGGNEAKWFAGTAQYSATFQKPSDPEADEWILDLGNIYHSAQLEINSQYIETLITSPFKINITNLLQEGKNHLNVKVTNLAANRIRYMEQKNIEHPRFYNTGLSFDSYGRDNPSEWPIMNSGLVGPVRLIPAKYINPVNKKNNK